jgi:hypothetical protein
LKLFWELCVLLALASAALHFCYPCTLAFSTPTHYRKVDGFGPTCHEHHKNDNISSLVYG